MMMKIIVMMKEKNKKFIKIIIKINNNFIKIN